MKQTTRRLVSKGLDKQLAIKLWGSYLTSWGWYNNSRSQTTSRITFGKTFWRREEAVEVKYLGVTLALYVWSIVTDALIFRISFIASGESYLVNNMR